MFLPYRALTGPKPPSRKDPGMTNEAEEATETTSAPKRRQERLRTLAVCLGSMTAIPWWPTLSSLSRSYQSGTFPLPADHAALLEMCIRDRYAPELRCCRSCATLDYCLEFP